MATAAVKANGEDVQPIDFGLAAHFLKQAEVAQQAGNERERDAACQMVAMIMGIRFERAKR